MEQWNGMEYSNLDGFDKFYLPIMTTSEQKPPLNKFHPNLITECIAIKHG